MSKEETENDSVLKSNDSESENNEIGYNEEEYLTSDDNKEGDNKNSEDESDSTSQEQDSDTEEEKTLCLKDGSEIFVLSVDGIPRFYTKTIEEARDKMWNYAKLRRIQETQYNTYIRGCPDKNRIEVVGCNKFSIFFVDRTICWLLVSSVHELETKKVQKTIDETNTQPVTPSTPIIDSPPKKTFFSSYFW